MKKIVISITILTLFLTSNVQAGTKPITIDNTPSCSYNKQTKCIDLMTSMYNKHATLYNVLNLSNDQQKCKDVIDKKRYEELKKQFQEYEKEKYVLDNMCKHNASEKALKKQKKSC